MNMTYPTVTWQYSPHTEAQRIVFVAQLIKSYFYQKQGFLVLPTAPDYRENAIYFPDLPLVHTQSFWDEIKTGDCTHFSISPTLLEEISNSISHLSSPPPTLLRDEMAALFPKIYERLHTFMPKVVSNFTHIEIRQTMFGSGGSAIREPHEEKQVARLYVRFDQNISSVVVAFLLRAIDDSNIDSFPHMHWEEKQSLIDFIVRDTAIADLIPHKRGTLASLREHTSPALRIASEQFLASIGFPSKQLFAQDSDGNILLQDEHITLRKQESQVLSLLIKKRHTIVSMNEIALVLWREEAMQRYSLYAIAKVIERIRKTIKALGIFPGIIETHRGQGFVLND